MPFPKALEPKVRTKIEVDEELLKIFQHVQIVISLIDAIKHISTYAKFLKNLCTPHRSPRRIILLEEARIMISHLLPRKCKDLSAPLITCRI